MKLLGIILSFTFFTFIPHFGVTHFLLTDRRAAYRIASQIGMEFPELPNLDINGMVTDNFIAINSDIQAQIDEIERKVFAKGSSLTSEDENKLSRLKLLASKRLLSVRNHEAAALSMNSSHCSVDTFRKSILLPNEVELAAVNVVAFRGIVSDPGKLTVGRGIIICSKLTKADGSFVHRLHFYVSEHDGEIDVEHEYSKKKKEIVSQTQTANSVDKSESEFMNHRINSLHNISGTFRSIFVEENVVHIHSEVQEITKYKSDASASSANSFKNTSDFLGLSGTWSVFGSAGTTETESYCCCVAFCKKMCSCCKCPTCCKCPPCACTCCKPSPPRPRKPCCKCPECDCKCCKCCNCPKCPSCCACFNCFCYSKTTSTPSTLSISYEAPPPRAEYSRVKEEGSSIFWAAQTMSERNTEAKLEMLLNQSWATEQYGLNVKIPGQNAEMEMGVKLKAGTTRSAHTLHFTTRNSANNKIESGMCIVDPGESASNIIKLESYVQAQSYQGYIPKDASWSTMGSITGMKGDALSFQPLMASFQ